MSSANSPSPGDMTPSSPRGDATAPPARLVRLGQLALTRSGDKGNHVNLGVVAYSQANYELLVDELTESRVADFFAESLSSGIGRYLLPNLGSLNFLLYNALGGGASRSLRLDSQGKLFGPAAAEIVLPVDADRLSQLELHSDPVVIPSSREPNQ
jgi:hypothetical protein